MLTIVEDAFALALGSRKTPIVNDLDLPAHQNPFLYGLLDSLDQGGIPLRIFALPPLDLNGHIIPSICPSVENDLVFTSDLGEPG